MITKHINININWDSPCRSYLLGFIDGWCYQCPNVRAEDGFGGDLCIIIEGNVPIEKLVGIFDEADIDFDRDVTVNYYVDNLKYNSSTGELEDVQSGDVGYNYSQDPNIGKINNAVQFKFSADADKAKNYDGTYQ